jgi:aminopeptidase N
MRTETARVVRLQDYRPPDWLVTTVSLDVRLHPHATRVRARLAMRPNVASPIAPSIVLDGEDLKLVDLRLDGAALSRSQYTVTAERLTIHQPPNRPVTVDIETEIDPSGNTQLSGLYRSNSVYCTQCEAEGFRRITFFPDRPDVMAVFTTRIEAEREQAPVLLSNGNLVEAGEVAGANRHYAVWHDPFPKPSYLFALVGGALACVEDEFDTQSGRRVALRIYVEPGNESRCGYAMDALKRSMRWDEQAFGREYDLDIFMIVAVSDFNMGAMENKGLNVFNDKYVLASPETATDADYASIEAIIAHEYFHNWTGNRITCRDWFQLCLKEGLTVFRDQEFTSDQRSRAVKRIADVRALRAHQFIEDAGPLAHPVRPGLYREINNFYTATVYEKGAEIIRMLKRMLGAEAFARGMDLYFIRHDGEAATVEQFLQCFADASGTDLTQFMRWYEQAGTPSLAVTSRWNEDASTLRLDLAQSVPPTPDQPHKAPMVIPLAMGLLGPDGKDMALRLQGTSELRDGVLLITEATQTVTFTGVEKRPVLSLNREFSAPIKLVTAIPPEDLRFLAAHDSDPFNRWQALQTLATMLMLERLQNGTSTAEMPADPGLVAALTNVLKDRQLEPALAALMITLPSEADIAREIAVDIDPDAIYAARAGLRAAVSQQMQELLRSVHKKMRARGPYSPDAASAGRRSSRNACLDLATACGERDAVALAAHQYDTADNMTDRMAALGTLSIHDVPARADALADFHDRYQHDPLVIDKWLALQAGIPEEATLDRVRALMRHEAFSINNPNRVRALIGTYAQANQTQFNRADGRGYRFVVDTVLDLDKRNPQLAARLMGAFKSWRALEPKRRGHAEAALRKVAEAQALSRDVADIAARALRPSDSP